MAINNAKLLPIQITQATFYVGLFVDQFLRIYGAAGSIPSNNLVTNPRWEEGETGWTTVLLGATSQVIYQESNTRLLPQVPIDQLLFNGGFEQGGAGWTVTEASQTSVTFQDNACQLTSNRNNGFCSIGQLVENAEAGTIHQINAALLSGVNPTLRIGTTNGGTDILEVVGWDGTLQNFTPTQDFWVNVQSQDNATTVIDNITVSQAVVGQAGVAQLVATTNGGQPHEIAVGTAGDQEYQIQVGTAQEDGTYLDVFTTQAAYRAEFTPAGDYWITVKAYGDTSPDVHLTGISSWFVEAVDEVGFVTPYLEAELRELYFVSTPEAATIYVLHPNHQPRKLLYDRVTDVWSFDLVTFVSPPTQWVAGNWPGVGAYFQGRLWLGSTPNEPQTFWASKSGEPENFDQGTAQPDEALEFTLANFGRIEWMIATKNMVIGTENSENIVSGDSTLDNLITPQSITVQQQSTYGSKSVQPIQVGDQIFYISPDGLKLRGMQYEWTAQNWLSRDLTFFSEHITESGVVDIAWAQHPDQLFWCVLENGDAACLTYERGENIFGWSKHNTDGRFIDMCAVQYYGTSFIVAATQRTAGNIDLEIQDSNYFMDAIGEDTALGIPGSTTTVFTGFTHLAGLLVQVILDGAIHPDVIVSPLGEITTEWPGHHCVAGIKYTPVLETLPFDQRTQSGSSQVYMKRYNKLYVSFLDSAEAVINGIRQPERFPQTPMDIRQPDKPGLSRVDTVNLGWDKDAVVRIEQDLPLACTVLSISGEHSLEKL